MTPDEFQAWIEVHENLQGGDEYWRERISEIVNAKVSRLEDYERPNGMVELADGIRWAAFCLAVSAVLVALVIKAPV